MSIAPLTARIRKKAKALRQTSEILRRSAEMVADEMKDNIDRRQNAGTYRVPDAGSVPGDVMDPLSKYTLADRERRGVHHDHPLKDSGRMYREIKAHRVSPTFAKAGPSTRRSRRVAKKQLGTAYTGITSSDLKEVIPPRNPFGYSQKTREKILALWRERFAMDGSVIARVKVDLKL